MSVSESIRLYGSQAPQATAASAGANLTWQSASAHNETPPVVVGMAVEKPTQTNGTESSLVAQALGAQVASASMEQLGPKLQNFGTNTGLGDAVSASAPGHAVRRHVPPQTPSYAKDEIEHSDEARFVDVAGQTVTSQADDTFMSHGQGGTTFVFKPGYGQATIIGFHLAGPGHDTIELPSPDFASFAQVLLDTQNTSSGEVIRDSTTGDTLLLSGITKTQLAQAKEDFAFQA